MTDTIATACLAIDKDASYIEDALTVIVEQGNEIYQLRQQLAAARAELARLRDERDCARIEAATAKAIGDPRC